MSDTTHSPQLSNKIVLSDIGESIPSYHGLANPSQIRHHAGASLIDGLSASALQSKILYRSSALYISAWSDSVDFIYIYICTIYILRGPHKTLARLMLRHQYQGGIFYSQTHVPAAICFTYELFSPLAERTLKSLNLATATARGTNYICRSLLNFRKAIIGKMRHRSEPTTRVQSNILILKEHSTKIN